MNLSTQVRSKKREQAGFTMLEMLVSLVIFLVIAGAAFSLLFAHAPLYTRQQNIAGLNIVLRNAVTQMQLDVQNAGTGYYPGPDVPSWPVGLTINNSNTSAGCYSASANTYGAGCFDSFTIITVDTSTPAAHPDPPGSSCGATDTNSVLFADAPTSWTGSTSSFASQFHNGDQLLIIKSDGSQMATTTLTQDGSVSGTKIKLQHNPTGASSSDPLGITNYFQALGAGDPNNKLGNTFCQADWILKLSWVQYSVDTTTPTNPKLTRLQAGGTAQVVAEQIVGFKVGATLWSGTTSGDTYAFNNYNYGAYDPSQIRSILVSLIGRTTPGLAGDTHYKNTFDNGNYEIQPVTVTINPRNLSMNDN